MIKIWYLNVQNVHEDVYKHHLLRLPEVVRNEITRFRFPKDQKFKLFGKLIVERFHRLHSVGFRWENWQLGEYGKPFLASGSEFSISHSGDYVCVAFSNNAIGLDLEQVTSIELDSVLQFLHVDEKRYVLEAERPAEAFFDVWTRKEAFLKARGCGLTTDMNARNCLADIAEDGLKWSMASLNLLPGYKMAVSTNAISSSFEISRLEDSSFV